jgi:leucyl aminopeptidase
MFDTGGVSLKRPYDTMVAMKSDMAGAAAIIGTMKAIAALGLNVRVTGLLMCAENLLSATSQRPSDVITHYGGTTVEVRNTDAEGRLVLADGLAYANSKLKPDYLLDIATLTGSATLGLGRQHVYPGSKVSKAATRDR